MARGAAKGIRVISCISLVNFQGMLSQHCVQQQQELLFNEMQRTDITVAGELQECVQRCRPSIAGSNGIAAFTLQVSKKVQDQPRRNVLQ